MATTQVNNLRKTIRGQHITFQILSSATYNQGDLVWFDTTNHYISALDSDTHAGSLAGVCLQTFPITSLGAGDGNTRNPSMEVGCFDIFEFKTTSGDTYYEGDAVYYATDAQTITNTVGGNTHPLGIIKLPPGLASAAASSFSTIDVYVNTKTAFN